MISTHSAREDGDAAYETAKLPAEISTHSAREDGDLLGFGEGPLAKHFNPLRPRGRRHLPQTN